jgi:hypothetical protein
MTRNEAAAYIANLGYGRDNADAWVLSAAFAEDGSWSHPAGVLTIRWQAKDNTYTVLAA